MSWELSPPTAANAFRLPYMALRGSFEFRWVGAAPVELASVTYWAQVEALGCFWPELPAATMPYAVHPGGTCLVEFVFPITLAFLRAVEDKRQPRVAPLNLSVNAKMAWRPGEVGGGPKLQQGQSRTNWVINRDDWLGALTVLGWDEFEVFEVPVRTPKRDERLEQGLAHLLTAQESFRRGHWSAVVTDARRAVEVAVAAANDDGSARGERPYEDFVERVFPDDGDRPKRRTLSGLMLALTHIRHVAAHGRLDCQVEREDAQVALTVTIAIFRYIGDALARTHGHRA